ncbi:unnamed protein product [Arabis nemorensis]|uniref:Cytochrome P450 n=1 Tax=Arabis nemorensis TaxID=586526 RepID=A0A565B6G9_9BRAS|nr:unnamed protein product [Arabis nemorensis]
MTHAIEWTMAEIINNRKTLERLRGEIDSVLGKTRLIQETDLPNLPYLQAVVKEGLRLHPPAPRRLEVFSLFKIIRKKGQDERGSARLSSFRRGEVVLDGSNLAYLVMGTTIGVMVQCFDWKIKGEKVNMDEAGGAVTLTMVAPTS